MDARRCDRCGAYYVSKGQVGILLVNGAIIPPRKKGIQLMYDGEPVTPNDLCEDCVASFKYWFDVPTLYNNDARGEKHD